MGKAILIVDDDAKNRKLLRVVLQSCGYKVTEAEDGINGIRLAEENTPNIVLMDIQMPVMDGIEAMKKLKSAPETSIIPVIALTSYAMRGDQERFLGEGFDGYICKPIDIDKMIEVIEKHVQTKDI